MGADLEAGCRGVLRLGGLLGFPAACRGQRAPATGPGQWEVVAFLRPWWRGQTRNTENALQACPHNEIISQTMSPRLYLIVFIIIISCLYGIVQ